MSEHQPTSFAKVTIPRDGEPPLTFSGVSLGAVSSDREGAELWTELKAWREETGKLIVQKLGRSRRPGHRDRSTAIVARDEAQLANQLGHGPLSVQLYDIAGLYHEEDLSAYEHRRAGADMDAESVGLRTARIIARAELSSTFLLPWPRQVIPGQALKVTSITRVRLDAAVRKSDAIIEPLFTLLERVDPRSTSMPALVRHAASAAAELIRGQVGPGPDCNPTTEDIDAAITYGAQSTCYHFLGHFPDFDEEVLPIVVTEGGWVFQAELRKPQADTLDVEIHCMKDDKRKSPFRQRIERGDEGALRDLQDRLWKSSTASDPDARGALQKTWDRLLSKLWDLDWLAKPSARNQDG